jgi:hypothetical protein
MEVAVRDRPCTVNTFGTAIQAQLLSDVATFWVDPAGPTGLTMPAPLAQILFRADPRDPMALFFWVGSATHWVDPAQSHPEIRYTRYK